jgi:FAD-linked oxidoreductase
LPQTEKQQDTAMTRLPDPQRRLLLKLLSTASAASLLPIQAARAAQKVIGKTLHWQNWSGDQQADPRHIIYPGDETAIKRMLQQDNDPIRCFGGGHSFSPLVPSDGTLVNLTQMMGMRHHDATNHTATFAAGTLLGVASHMAYNVGQSIPNESDINVQSLAGAICTATHGTGTRLQSLSAYVQSLRLVTPGGQALNIDKTSPLFHAARCSLGALGVITEITFQNEPAYKLEEKTHVVSIKEAMDYTEKNKDKHRNLEFFAFPFGDTAILKTLDYTDKPDLNVTPEDDNETLKLACEVSMRASWLIPLIQKMLGVFVSDQTRRAPSYAIYPSARNVRFNEIEYAVPAEQGLAIFEETADIMRKSDVSVFFPIEYRYCAAEDNWLSQFYQRDSATISVHQYFKQDYKPLFEKVEPVFKRHGGRPHWGKINTFTTTDARKAYEHFDDFIKMQRELDPKGRMLNPYLKTLFGVA